jgi:hypothetical protein
MSLRHQRRQLRDVQYDDGRQLHRRRVHVRDRTGVRGRPGVHQRCVRVQRDLVPERLL